MSIGLVISNTCLGMAVLSMPLIFFVSPAMLVLTFLLGMIGFMIRSIVKEISTSIVESNKS